MLTVRRIYLYLVSAISLIAVVWAVIALARLVIDPSFGEGQIIALASGLAVIIVGSPIFGFHWFLAQRLAANDAAERESVVRTLFFFGVMAAAAVPVFSNLYRLLDNLLLALLGGNRPNYYPYDLSTADHLIAIVVWTVIWLFFWRFIRSLPTQPIGPGQHLNLTVRRVYLLAFSLGGLAMVTWGSTGLLQTIMEMLTGLAWRTPVANYSAQLIVGTLLWLAHWLVHQQDFGGGSPAEERSVLRKVYLYLAVFIFSIMALSSGALLLKRLFELVLGAPPSGQPLLEQLSTVVPLLLVGGVFWMYHWLVLRQDAAQAPVAPRQASVRRVYAYLVAAVGLSVLLSGVTGLLILIVDLWTSPADVGFDYYREMLALFMAMTIVGTPVWWLPWRHSQGLATRLAAKRENSETQSDTFDMGSEERRSTVRKIYLYLYVFIASLAIFGSVGWFVFRLLTALLGADLPTDFITQVLNAFVIALVAAGVWVYHWLAIRQDGELAQEMQVHQFADTLVVVIDDDEGQLGQAVISKLRDNLPGVQLKPLGLTEQATSAMAGRRFSATAPETTELMKMANFVVGSWRALTGSDVAGAVSTATATKFVVPLPAQNWVWTGVRRYSTEEHAEQIAKGLKQAVAGEEIDFDGGPDVGMVIGVGIGVLLFLCIAGNLITFAAGVL